MNEKPSEDNLVEELLEGTLKRYISLYWGEEEAITVAVGIGKNDEEQLCIMHFVLEPSKVKNIPAEFEGLPVEIRKSGGIPKPLSTNSETETEKE